MNARRWELVTTDESTVVSESLLDTTVVEDGKRDRCLPDPSCADESEWSRVFCEIDDLLD